MPIRTYEASVASYNEWEASTVYAQDTYVEPVEPNGKCYKATTGGTSGTVEPDWPITVDETENDGTVVWTCENKASSPSAISAELDTEGYGGMGLLEVWVKSDAAATFTVEGSHTGQAGSYRWIEELALPYKSRTDRHKGYLNAYRFVKVSTDDVNTSEIEIVGGET